MVNISRKANVPDPYLGEWLFLDKLFRSRDYRRSPSAPRLSERRFGDAAFSAGFFDGNFNRLVIP